MNAKVLHCLFTLTLSVVAALPLAAQVETKIPPVIAGARPVAVEHIKVHGAALEGNLEGEAVDRDVLVFLPPDYGKDKSRRYPVLYALHGYSIGAEQWTHEIHVPQTIEGAFAQGAKEMIVVLPDSKTIYGGSIYSSSVTTGDFEKFIAHDLVAYVDAHYRTLANRKSRGLAGHSMGGYGTTRIGMRHPDVFGSLYIMSPGLLSAHSAALPNMGPSKSPEDDQRAFEAAVAALRAPKDAATLPGAARAQLAVAAAWSPNPRNPPLFLDLPLRDGKTDATVLAKWAANAPLAFIDQCIANLRQYQAIGLDVGDQDPGLEESRQLKGVFDRYGIAVAFEIYQGTHTSAVADRFQNHVLPFFSSHFCQTRDCAN
ncbi:MAG: alpha/beta fold hydrolase [Pseudomonadota bacterium]